MDIQIQRDETGALSKVSHRSRYVAKGFTQIKNVHYFESFAPVASFVKLRLVFVLTALPHLHVNHYDVSVAFIESELDDSTPPVYCECAEGYKDPRVPSTEKPIRHDTEPEGLVSTAVHDLHVIWSTETCYRRMRTHQVREQQEKHAATA